MLYGKNKIFFNNDQNDQKFVYSLSVSQQNNYFY